jgi:hypothetical protein
MSIWGGKTLRVSVEVHLHCRYYDHGTGVALLVEDDSHNGYTFGRLLWFLGQIGGTEGALPVYIKHAFEDRAYPIGDENYPEVRITLPQNYADKAEMI